MHSWVGEGSRASSIDPLSEQETCLTGHVFDLVRHERDKGTSPQQQALDQQGQGHSGSVKVGHGRSGSVKVGQGQKRLGCTWSE